MQLINGAEFWATMVLSQSRIVRIEWNPKIIGRASKNKPVVPVLNQISPVHAIPSFFLNIKC